MFFMIGITEGRKSLEHDQMIICGQCGSYGRYQVFMTYMVLTIFFIPCIKWNKRYFVQSTCCSAVYELDAEIGKRIARGEELEILPRHLRQVQTGRGRHRQCRNCGYATQEDFEFCPKCGQRL